MIASSVILDVLLLAIFAVCVYLGVRRGLFRTLAELVSWIIALLLSSAVANAFTTVVMDRLRPVLEGQVSQAITDYLQALVDETGYEGLFGGLLAGALKGLLLVLLELWLGETTGLLATGQAMDSSVFAPILLKLLPA